MIRIATLVVALAVAFGAIAERPDLVVVLAVDQLRWDYVERFKPWFTERGFKRFAVEGATFPNARYRYGAMSTGPGHAAIGSGLVPAESGIPSNRWFERDAPVDAARWQWYFEDITPYRPPVNPRNPRNSEKPVGGEWWKQGGSPQSCAYDPSVRVTAGKTSGMSPVHLDGDSLGDRMKAKDPRSRVIAIALKDSAAILMGGRHADAAYWFDYRVPAFISSTYYRFNPSVLAFNDLVPGYVPGSKRWMPSPYIPRDELQRVTFDPPEAWPLKNGTYEGTFPHPIESIRALTYSPFMHQAVLDFAQHVIAVEQLGARRGIPDALFVGISSTDNLGHYYGPDSMEVADSMVRLDRMLADFLDALERRFGDRLVVALTSDHGVQDNPEIVKLRDPKADVGRVDIRSPDPLARRVSDLPPARIEIERRLASKLGVKFDIDAPLTHALVYFFEEPCLWLNQRRLRTLGLNLEAAKLALRDVLRGMPGIANVWTNSELAVPNPRATRIEQLMRDSFHPTRSGDVLIALRPGWIWMWGSNSTTHGQPVEQDLHVPLMFWGAAIKPGTYPTDASPTDLAPTLGALVGVRVGGRAARVLPCVER